MSDEIYINTKNAPHSQLGQLGSQGSFQQPYQGQAAVTGTLQAQRQVCLLYTSPSPRDTERSRMPSSA